MGEKDQHDQLYVIDSFPGLFEGTTLSKLPPGALIAGRGGADPKAKTNHIQISEDGEIRNSGFYSRITGIVNSVKMSGIHYWRPSKGGDWVLVFDEDVVKYLRFRFQDPSMDPDFFALPTNIGDVNRIPVNHQDVYGCFEEFGDALYYADGMDYPLRIDLSVIELDPQVFRMGLGDLAKPMALLMSLVYKPYLAMNARRVGVTHLYAVTVLSRYGESNASVVPVPGSVPTEGFTTQATWFGSIGATPVLYLDWTALGIYPIHAVRIYRYDQLAGQYRLLVQLPRQDTNSASSFVDTKSDGELGFPLNLDNAPPPRLRLLCAFQGRMFGVGGFENPNRVSFSKQGLPDVWPPQYELNLSGLDTGDSIVQMKTVGGNLYLFLQNRILRLFGDTPETYQVELVTGSVGCIAPRTLARYQEGVVFLSRDGIYHFDGSYPKRLSAPVYGLFERPATGAAPLSRACGVVAGDFYYLSYSEQNESVAVSTTIANRVLIVNMRNGRWGVRSGGHFRFACPYKDGQALTVGTLDGTLNLISDWTMSDSDKGGPDLYFGHTDFGHPDSVKSLKHVEVIYEALAPVTMELIVYREYPVTEPTDSAYKSSSTDTQTPTGIPKWGDDWALASDYYGIMRVWRANFNYDKMTGKSFAFSISVGEGSPELRIQRMTCRYEVEHREWLGQGVII